MGGTVTAAYTYGNALLRRNVEVPLYDALGSERTVTDGSGSVTGSIAYEAFGQAVATNGSSSSPYTFAATSRYRNDGDAGLTHVGARYYDAQAGRFITRDTVLDQHPYLYCGHDPVNALDPSGHGWWGTIGGIAGNLVGGAIGGLIGGPGGAMIGARLGGFIVGTIGAHYGDGTPWLGAIGTGAISLVGSPIAAKTGGVVGIGLRNWLWPPEVIDPVTKTVGWRLISSGAIKRL